MIPQEKHIDTNRRMMQLLLFMSSILSLLASMAQPVLAEVDDQLVVSSYYMVADEAESWCDFIVQQNVEIKKIEVMSSISEDQKIKPLFTLIEAPKQPYPSVKHQKLMAWNFNEPAFLKKMAFGFEAAPNSP